MSSFSWTGDIIGVMILYGIIAFLSEKVGFEWKIAAGGILFIFIIEIIANYLHDKREDRKENRWRPNGKERKLYKL